MENKIIKILIPIIAIVIIFESVVLVSSLEKKETEVISVDQKEEVVVEKKIIYDVSLSSENQEVSVGKKTKISAKIKAMEDSNLNALDLYIKYDPEMITISNLSATKELETPTFLKASEKKKVIAVNYLFEDKEGASFVKNQEVLLLTFDVTPIKIGEGYFEISTGDSEGDSVTMFVDKISSKGLDFASNKLEISFIK